VLCRNWGIIRARNIAILHLRKYPTFRMLHSLGGPLFYIYTLTVDGRTTDAAGTNLYGSGSGRRIPVPGQPSGRRQPSYKCITDGACVSLGYFPGWRTGGPYLALRPSLHLAQALSNRLGACKCRKKHLLDLAMT